MSLCGKCNDEIKDGEDHRDSMHYGKIHNRCHDKMLSDLGDEFRKNRQDEVKN